MKVQDKKGRRKVKMTRGSSGIVYQVGEGERRRNSKEEILIWIRKQGQRQYTSSSSSSSSKAASELDCMRTWCSGGVEQRLEMKSG